MSTGAKDFGPQWQAWYASLHEASAGFPEQTLDGQHHKQRLVAVRRLIEQDYSDALQLTPLARRAGISSYHFLRLFQQEFDCTPHEHVTRCRIARAKELLASTNTPITEVCLEVGFSSLGSFSSLFRRHVGSPPSAYRRVWTQNLWRPAAIPGCFLAAFSGQAAP